MRTDLFVISENCSCGDSCRVCNDLGYVAEFALSELEIMQLIEGINSSITDSVVIPGSSLLHPKIEQYLALINKNKLFVFTYDFWNKSHSKYRKKISGYKLAIVFDKFENFNSSILPQDSIVYVACYRDNIDLLKNFYKKVIGQNKFRYFFPSNNLHQPDKFRMNEIFDMRLLEYENLLNVRYETPFSHDIVDARNPKHSRWIFSATETIKVSVPNPKIEITIIIPFCNRTEFIKKILPYILANTLEHEAYEIVLVDDGSSLEQFEKLREYLLGLVGCNLMLYRLNRSEKITESYDSNRVGPVRNFGASKAAGKTLLFLDSDILIPKTYLARLRELHNIYHIVSPVRKYLNKQASTNHDLVLDETSEENLMATPWDQYMNDLYNSRDWMSSPHSWLYFMTYCLSVDKDLFFESGGFRTNYISYGFEDLDLGSRLLRLPNIEFYNWKIPVYHLYHFDGEGEYTLEQDLRYFQLVFSASTFVAQNYPLNSPGLQRLCNFRSENQQRMFLNYIEKKKENELC